jgi:hypothetical protein
MTSSNSRSPKFSGSAFQSGPRQDIDILEDGMLYTEEEMTILLNVLDDASKAIGGLKFKCLSWGLLGPMSSTGEYYMLVITKRCPVDVVEPSSTKCAKALAVGPRKRVLVCTGQGDFENDRKVLCCLAGLRFTYCMPNDVQLSKLIEGSLYHGASS